MDPGALSQIHVHPHSEQIWLVEQGRATLLLPDGQSASLSAGDVVLTPSGEKHGVENIGTEPFVYLAITTPPQDFTASYRDKVVLK